MALSAFLCLRLHAWLRRPSLLKPMDGEGEGSGIPVPIRPMALAPSANQRLPSGPAAIPTGALPGLRPVLNSVICPTVLTRPIAAVVPVPVNHREPSGPAAIWRGLLPGLRPSLNSVIAPAGVMRPISVLAPLSVNQRLPSGPRAIACGCPQV